MSDHNSIVIVAAKRTPIGNFNGALSSVPAHELGAHLIKILCRKRAWLWKKLMM